MFWKPDVDLYPTFLRSRVRRGKGIGKGLGYKPWYKTSDVPSHGTSSCVLGIQVDRHYDLLSELEVTYFFLLERRQGVLDIREQFPILDIPRTLELCSQLNVQHKYVGIYPEPFTIDFIVTENIDGKVSHRAASIKSAADAQDPAVRQRLAVEKMWCQEKGIQWSLVDTSQFSKTLLENLRFIRAWFLHRYKPEDAEIAQFLNMFSAQYSKSMTLNAIIAATARAINRDEAVTLDMFRYCAWRNFIHVSLSSSVALNRPLILVQK
ncbi:TnsA endonuclease N-terminal domain-containing protein [Duganella sp. HH105]|uniref:TnsA endonuclease N-terminal domain-containing protein n=1 Tax=Duganella sp. HH105 TaxID=1781067 RepID=UPI000892E3E8|nr:TnsA endonuclease N-terminal domain-containing protein [Duganella sp. HH105]OEZ61270.1 transposon Tn7 transposition protein TnsA [Duganella sp. HH105]